MENLKIFLQNFQSAGGLMKKSIILLHRMGFFVKPRREIIIYSLTISVKDENGVLFDIDGLPLEFEIEIK